MPPAICIEKLSCRFGDTVAVDGLTLQVEAGEVFGFLGHNGAGKTTTVRLLNGILQPTAGGATVLGLDPVADGPLLRRRTGVVTGTPSLDDRLTAHDVLRFSANLYGVPRREIDRRIDELMDLFGLSDRQRDNVGTLSKGMKQRLSVARALLHQPDILFLDEPASGLDPVGARLLHELISSLSADEGRTVFLCTHNLAEAQKLCDRVAVLQQGRLLALGTPRQLAEQVSAGQHLIIETDAARVADAIAVIESAPSRCNITHNASHITVTGMEREGIPAVVRSLVNRGVPVYQVRIQEATLEDVYFALHEDGEQAS